MVEIERLATTLVAARASCSTKELRRSTLQRTFFQYRYCDLLADYEASIGLWTREEGQGESHPIQPQPPQILQVLRSIDNSKIWCLCHVRELAANWHGAVLTFEPVVGGRYIDIIKLL